MIWNIFFACPHPEISMYPILIRCSISTSVLTWSPQTICCLQTMVWIFFENIFCCCCRTGLDTWWIGVWMTVCQLMGWGWLRKGVILVIVSDTPGCPPARRKASVKFHCTEVRKFLLLLEFMTGGRIFKPCQICQHQSQDWPTDHQGECEC